MCRLTFESVFYKMQEDRSYLKPSTVAKKYIKNHVGAKILAAGYTKGTVAFILMFRCFTSATNSSSKLV